MTEPASNTGPSRPAQAWQALIEQGHLVADAEQQEAVQALDTLWQTLAEPPRRNLLGKLAGVPPAAPEGLYLWGSVGRGKTRLMDLFHSCLPAGIGLRVHFHRFMARVHRALREQSRARDPLAVIARHWAAQCRVLCFDEFFVADIADAMLLSGLLSALFEHGVTLVATSNVHPDRLYVDGLQRARFMPAIKLLKTHTRVLEVAGDTDYRLRLLEQSPVFHYPLGPAADEFLSERFLSMSGGQHQAPAVQVHNRSLSARQRGDGVVWFTFDDLCRQPCGTEDFIELARRFHTVMLANVPVLGQEDGDAARRFINLVDEFYDRNVNLLITAAAPPEQLYRGRRLTFEFSRTSSRLIEMQSRDYLARAHLH